MARKELSVEPREVLGKKIRFLRRQGILPANVYGHGLDSVSIQVNAAAFYETLKASTANEVIDLNVGGERAARPVVMHHVQRHPLTSSILHVDFYQVSLREKMRADVPIVLVGSSDAVTTYNGTLLTGIESLHVEALPLDLPAQIEVDVSVLTQVDTAIHVRDIKVPENVTVLSDLDVVVAQVAAPRVSVEGEEPVVQTGTAAAATEEASGGGDS
jgi:large subunit ribosomal protein L25